MNLAVKISAVLLLSLTACKKETTPETNAKVKSPSQINAKGGGSTATGILQNVAPFKVKLKSGDATSLLVSFTTTAPAGGYTLQVTSSNAAVQVPATYEVPAGSYVEYLPISTTVISGSAINVTITVKLGTESKTVTIKLYPLSFILNAPSLQSPGNNASFANPKLVTFKWTDNANAFYHYIQISNTPDFAKPLWLEISTDNPVYATSYFGNNVRYYWRVCYVDASNNLGPWSPVRTFFYRG